MDIFQHFFLKNTRIQKKNQKRKKKITNKKSSKNTLILGKKYMYSTKIVLNHKIKP